MQDSMELITRLDGENVQEQEIGVRAGEHMLREQGFEEEGERW